MEGARARAPTGLTLDGSGNLISAGGGFLDTAIFIHSGITSTVTTSFAGPSDDPMGLTIDGSGNLISVDWYEDRIYIHSGITSTITTSFASPAAEPRCLTLDGSGNLISSDSTNDSIYIHSSITSTVTTSFSSPGSAPTGLTLQPVAPVGWTGKISGVTDPVEIMGVAVANIVQVKGVA